jgi:choline dehydrogenase-like flavoprotein
VISCGALSVKLLGRLATNRTRGHARPFFKKSEKFHAPDEDAQLANKAFYDPDGFGTQGPIEVSYATEYSASHRYWHNTLQHLGIPTNSSHMLGYNVGAWTNLGSVNPQTCTRSSSATAYYQPNKNRTNLVVLSEALVEKVILVQEDESWAARGVQYFHKGRRASAFASKEVIICAGSVQSPQILELSGIGNPDILRSAGVETRVPSPFVGENLQDHIMAASIYEVDPSLPNPDDLKADPGAAAAAREEFESKRTGPLAILANSLCYLSLSQVMPEEAFSRLVSKAKSIQDDFSERSQIRRERFDPSLAKLGQIEYLFDLGNWNPYFQPDHASTGKKYGTMLQILQYPFSRGSIHIRSANPTDKPSIDPRYYQDAGGSLDLDIMVECAKFAEKVTQTPLLSGIVHGRVVPPVTARTDDELRDWLVRETITDWCVPPIVVRYHV